MKQELRKLFQEAREKESFPLSENHQQRFKELLEQKIPKKSKSNWWYAGIAASILLVMGLGLFIHAAFDSKKNTELQMGSSQKKETEVMPISLSDLSPDLKKVEQYYLTNINLELAKLEMSAENEELIKAYMEQLAVLNKEYQGLNVELNTLGPNDQTIAALIQNLQLRLQLLQKLKEKLNELKQSTNETVNNI